MHHHNFPANTPTQGRPIDGAIRARPKLFIDENGEASDRSGPDLTLAEPIDEVVAYLGRRRRGTYGLAFLQAAHASGISVSMVYRPDGGVLMSGLPADGQEHLRLPRYQALFTHLEARSWRRQAVIDCLNQLGHFTDNRPYESVAEAAEFYLSVGGRIMVRPDGGCEEIIPGTDQQERLRMQDSWEGYPRRRGCDRYEATLRQAGAREKMAELVRQHGMLHEGSGWIVWEGASPR